jgi:uncharacterized protein (TIGR00369 family)
MDRNALATFLETEFPQADGQYRVERLTDEGLILRLVVDHMHLRPGGTVSGPAMFGLADVAVYLAILSRIGPEALAVTTSCSIDFMRKPAAGKDVLAEVRLLKLGRRLAVADAYLKSEGNDDIVARASMTYSIPPSVSGG